MSNNKEETLLQDIKSKLDDAKSELNFHEVQENLTASPKGPVLLLLDLVEDLYQRIDVLEKRL